MQAKWFFMVLASLAAANVGAQSYQVRSGIIFGNDGMCYRAPGSGVPDWSQFKIEGQYVISSDGLRCRRTSKSDSEIEARDKIREESLHEQEDERRTQQIQQEQEQALKQQLEQSNRAETAEIEQRLNNFERDLRIQNAIRHQNTGEYLFPR